MKRRKRIEKESCLDKDQTDGAVKLAVAVVVDIVLAWLR